MFLKCTCVHPSTCWRPLAESAGRGDPTRLTSNRVYWNQKAKISEVTPGSRRRKRISLDVSLRGGSRSDTNSEGGAFTSSESCCRQRVGQVQTLPAWSESEVRAKADANNVAQNTKSDGFMSLGKLLSLKFLQKEARASFRPSETVHKHKGTFETRHSFQKGTRCTHCYKNWKDTNKPAQSTKTGHASFPLIVSSHA